MKRHRLDVFLPHVPFHSRVRPCLTWACLVDGIFPTPATREDRCARQCTTCPLATRSWLVDMSEPEQQMSNNGQSFSSVKSVAALTQRNNSCFPRSGSEELARVTTNGCTGEIRRGKPHPEALSRLRAIPSHTSQRLCAARLRS